MRWPATWGTTWLDDFLRDLRYALRSFARSPLFVAAAVLSLAIGIGANTAMFSVVNALMLRSMPVRAPGQLWHPYVRAFYGRDSFSYLFFRDLQKRSDLFRSVVGASAADRALVTLGDSQTPEPLPVGYVSGNYFSDLGVQPAIGRPIEAGDDVSDAPPVAVISQGLWTRRLGRNPDVLGQTVRVNKGSFTIVGVAPPEFFGVFVGEPADIWLPLVQQAAAAGLPRTAVENHDRTWIDPLVRYQAHVATGQVQSAMQAMYMTELVPSISDIKDPATRKMILDSRVVVEPGGKGISELRESASVPLKLLMGIVALLLLIACANVANLLLARAAARAREISTRLALGAGRRRIIRQLLTESVLLGLLGGVAGLLLAQWLARLLPQLLDNGSRRLQLDLSPDARVLAFAFCISVFTGVLFGLAPALRIRTRSLAADMKDAPTSWATAGKSRLAKSLVAAQVAVCLVLLSGGVLFARSLRNFLSQEMGFTRQNVVMLYLDIDQVGYRGPALLQMYDHVLERVRAVPGIRNAAFVQHGFHNGGSLRCCIAIAGYQPRPGEDRGVRNDTVTSGYFSAMGIPVIAGRDFEDRDITSAHKAVVINETLAHHYFGNSNPVGRRLGWADGAAGEYEIIGVVKGSRYSEVKETPPRFVYFAPGINGDPRTPTGVDADRLGILVLRTAADPAAVIASARRALAESEPNLHVIDTATLNDLVDRSLSEDRTLAMLSGLFAALALLLACVGLYGVMACSVTRRTREIGIRMAMGATPRDAAWHVMRETLMLVAGGIAVGLPAAILAARLFASRLFGLSAGDPATFASVVFVLGATALAAGWLPGRRAARVDPMKALRTE